VEPNVRLAALGDVALVAREALKALSIASSFFHSLDADIILANLEAPIGRGYPTPGKINLYSPEESVLYLRDAGINVVNLANNHIMDYGEIAAKRTMRLLKEAGIHYFGIGTLSDIVNPVVLKVKGLRLAFMGYAAPTTHPIFASNDTLGCDRLNIEKIVDDIQTVKQEADCIIVSLHWGFQDQFYPTPEQIAQAHTIIDAGAHVIIGHHAHVFQGFEQYKKGIIFYGLGNFIFPNVKSDSYFDEHCNSRIYNVKWYSWNQYSIVPVLEVSKAKECKVKVVKIIFTKFDPAMGILQVLRGAAESRMRKRLSIISRPIAQPYYPIYWRIEKRISNLRLMWAKWKENGFKPALKVSHLKVLFNRVVLGKLPELDDEKS